MIVKTFPVGAFQCNCTILADEENGEAVIIDPGDEAERIVREVRKLDYNVKYILHTHAHIDHIGGTTTVRDETGGEIALHKDDLFLYDQLGMQGRLLGLPAGETRPVDCYLAHGDVIEWGKNAKTDVLHTPGHTPGSLTFFMKGLVGKNDCLFTGDTLFMGSVGRTDLWGGDFGQLISSIKKHILPLRDETIVIPGHGPNTTIGEERRMNPFLKNL